MGEFRQEVLRQGSQEEGRHPSRCYQGFRVEREEMRQIVIISRKWNHPKISMIVTDDDISFCMDLSDFRDALKQELALTNGQIEKIDEAFQSVIDGIKNESVRIMA